MDNKIIQEIEIKPGIFFIRKNILIILPFLLFFILYSVFEPRGANSFVTFWVYINKTISLIILLGTIIGLLLKKYKSNWFYVWLGFSLYYSTTFLIDRWWGYFLWIEIIHFTQLHKLDSTLSLPKYIFPNLYLFFIFFINILIFFILLRYLKIEKIKLFLLVFSYYFVYCFYLTFQYVSFIVKSTIYWKCFKTFLILNSMFSIIFLMLLFFFKKKLLRIFSFLLFLLLNFLSINFFKLKELFFYKTELQLESSVTEFANLVVFYIKYFLLYSNFIYLILFLLIYNFFEHYKKK